MLVFVLFYERKENKNNFPFILFLLLRARAAGAGGYSWRRVTRLIYINRVASLREVTAAAAARRARINLSLLEKGRTKGENRKKKR